MSRDKAGDSRFLEQNLHNLLLQKQAFEMELAELEASLRELEKSGEEVFKIIGQLMLKKKKSEVKQAFLDKKKTVSSHLSVLKRRESSLLGELDKSRKK